MQLTNITLLPASLASAYIHRPIASNALRANSPTSLRLNRSAPHTTIVRTLTQEAAQ